MASLKPSYLNLKTVLKLTAPINNNNNNNNNNNILLINYCLAACAR